MNHRTKRVWPGLLLASLTALACWSWLEPDAPYTGNGDPAALSGVYQHWKSAYESRAGGRILRIGLAPSRALSGAAGGARGRAVLDLVDGRLRIDVEGLSARENYDVWLVDRHAATAGEPMGSREARLGTLGAEAGRWSLSTTLDREHWSGFTLDGIVVARSGAAPAGGALLAGSPSLFQRLYYGGQFWMVARVGRESDDSTARAPAFEFLLPRVAVAGSGTAATASDLEKLIARGEELFTGETFDGNGRTCATCHRPDNNHTIDPDYIRGLHKADPLFVAETNPDLKDLERPALLRQFGLFVANVDGFDKPAVLRSTPHLLALSASLTFETKEKGGEFQEDSDYFAAHDGQAQAVGWSQDGAPDGGSLRDFTKGAVKQHLPRSLNRVAGVDFREPTEDELDALEAYMLSLGRSADIDLASLHFKSSLVETGKLLFDQKQNPVDAQGRPIFGRSANCNGCHQNAGAMSSTTAANPTRDTGVERMRDQLHRLADPAVPYDGGFGQLLQYDCGPDFNARCYSDGSLDPRGVRPASYPRLNRFNTPPLVEAADTGPFFHNHSVGTLEEAVAYYNTDAFNTSPGAFTSKGANRQTRIDSSQVQAVALFLRTINVLENIRSANLLAEKAMVLNRTQGKKMARLALADTEDAIEVIRNGVFIPYPDALASLELALKYEKLAISSLTQEGRKQRLRKAIARQEAARAMMVDEGSS